MTPLKCPNCGETDADDLLRSQADDASLIHCQTCGYEFGPQNPDDDDLPDDDDNEEV